MRILSLWRSFFRKKQTPMQPWEKIQPWEKRRADGGNSMRWHYDDLTESSLVIDLGGFKGEFASEINKRYGCKVLVFEPHPVFFEECKKNLRGNSKIQVFNYRSVLQYKELQPFIVFYCGIRGYRQHQRQHKVY